ncbi:MAG: sulfatase-like hydrolase/transferase [Bryobacterales bacterium]|nr:sulfatase-like hydrolase/transferase [Bryobacterales bacterium]
MRTVSRRNFFASMVAPFSKPARSPNVIILTFDGWRGPSLESRGDSYLRAPNLMRLTTQALEFTRAYAARPVPATEDSPILTGDFPHRLGRSPLLRIELEQMGYTWGDFTSLPVDRAAEFIRAKRKEVFAAWCPGRLPQQPLSRYRIPYDHRPIPGRPNMPDDHHDSAWQAFAAYYVALSAADAELGKVLRALDETGLGNDTILVFTSHCGNMAGSHGMDGNDEFYEESASIPLLIRYPWRFSAAGRLEFPVSLTDLTPTLLALCEAGPAPSLPGRNLAPLLLGETAEQPQSVFVEGKLGQSGSWRMVVRGVNKLVVDRRQQVTGLYNIGLDPYETGNQATARSEELTRDEMRAILRDWISRTGDWPVRSR